MHIVSREYGPYRQQQMVGVMPLDHRERLRFAEQDIGDRRKQTIVLIAVCATGAILIGLISNYFDQAIMLLIGGGLVCFCFGALASFSGSPKFGERTMKLGGFLIGVAVVLFFVATVFLTLNHARIAMP